MKCNLACVCVCVRVQSHRRVKMFVLTLNESAAMVAGS